MLTAKGQLEDKVEWFWCGADDYLVKPFDLDELLLRIKAIMKRKNKFDTFVFWDIEVILPTRKILKKGKEVHLSIKEFHILEYLIKNHGSAVSRTDIFEYVWWETAIWEENNKLDVYIANLRKKLDKHLITTIKWYGYTIEKK
jgi:DNA-binding response OmpR family regulator